MAPGPKTGRVRRFGATERTLHWIHVAGFGGLLLTGGALYSPTLAGVLGSREALKSLHVTIAGAWLVGVAVTVGLGDRGALRRTIGELEVLDADDRRWLRGRPAPQGRFNAGQKVHALLQAAFATLFVISGGLLVAGERDTDLRLSGTIALHDLLTLVATALVLGHVHLAVVHRPTRPALSGMLTGTVPAAWAAAHHAKWAPGPPPPVPRSRAASVAWLVVAAAVAAVVLRLR